MRRSVLTTVVHTEEEADDLNSQWISNSATCLRCPLCLFGVGYRVPTGVTFKVDNTGGGDRLVEKTRETEGGSCARASREVRDPWTEIVYSSERSLLWTKERGKGRRDVPRTTTEMEGPVQADVPEPRRGGGGVLP